MIDDGDLSEKPGWIRMSIHPTHTTDEIIYMVDAIKQLASHFQEWVKDYELDYSKGIIRHKDNSSTEEMGASTEHWFHDLFMV